MACAAVLTTDGIEANEPLWCLGMLGRMTRSAVSNELDG